MNSEPERDFRTVTEQDNDYPRALRELPDRPSVLYVKGRWPVPDNKVIGIVGTRRASAYGLEAAKYFTTDLVQHGFVTVSGLAAGIDACAHRTTLKEGGWTVAVLGHGFRYYYPKENRLLFDDIAQQGTLVTEFPYDTEPQASHFPQRNRIISGLSQGVLVIEAGHRSGAGITARCAAEQGRDVFAVPGSIYSHQSTGCHRLIKEGAKLVENAGEILTEYGFFEPVFDRNISPRRIPEVSLTAIEKKVLQFTSEIPISVDELVELSAMPIDRLAEVLLSLEINGRIRAIAGQRYVRYGSVG